MTRPPCIYERDATYEYECLHDHCPVCGAHAVYVSKTTSVRECQVAGSCTPPLEAFS